MCLPVCVGEGFKQESDIVSRLHAPGMPGIPCELCHQASAPQPLSTACLAGGPGAGQPGFENPEKEGRLVIAEYEAAWLVCVYVPMVRACPPKAGSEVFWGTVPVLLGVPMS